MAKYSLRIVIADDDEPVRNMLKNYINSFFDDVEIVGLAADGEDLLEIAEKALPDAVFVDIQMPGLDGLSAAHLLQRKFPGLFVVFISAYTHYAVEAFNLDAVDFLTKPVSADRLGRSLSKIKRYKVLADSRKKEPAARLDGQLVLKSGHGLTILNKSTVLFVEKQGQKCFFHTTGGIFESICPLISLEKTLDPFFFRCHKSFLINISQVEKIMPYADRAYEITFRNYPHKATMRRDKFEEFCKLIKQDFN